MPADFRSFKSLEVELFSVRHCETLGTENVTESTVVARRLVEAASLNLAAELESNRWLELKLEIAEVFTNSLVRCVCNPVGADCMLSDCE